MNPKDERSIRIMANLRKHGRCRDCKRSIVWVVTAPHGKYMPFDREPLVLGIEQNQVTLVRFEVIASLYCHFESCPKRHQPRARVEQPRLAL